MSRLFSNASSQYLEITSALLTAMPMTMAGWAYSTDLTKNFHLLSISTTTSDAAWWITMNNTAGGQTIAANSMPAFTSSASAGTYSANTWVHVAGVFLSTTSRTSYLNGTASTTNTSSANPTTTNVTNIGAIFVGAARTDFPTGGIAEVGLWDIDLSANEIAALARGVLPIAVQPDHLVGYWPLWGLHSPEINLGTNHTGMTLGGTPTQANHAPVTRYTRKLGAIFTPEDLVLTPNVFDTLGVIDSQYQQV